MPFQSEKQRRYLWANEPEIARDWTDTYGSGIAKALGGRIPFAEAGSTNITLPTGLNTYIGWQGIKNDYPELAEQFTDLGINTPEKIESFFTKYGEQLKQQGKKYSYRSPTIEGEQLMKDEFIPDTRRGFWESLFGGAAEGAETGSTAEDQMRQEFFDYGTQQADMGDTAYSNLKVPGLNVKHPEGIDTINIDQMADVYNPYKDYGQFFRNQPVDERTALTGINEGIGTVKNKFNMPNLSDISNIASGAYAALKGSIPWTWGTKILSSLAGRNRGPVINPATQRFMQDYNVGRNQQTGRMVGGPFAGRNLPGTSMFGSKTPQQMAQNWMKKYGGMNYQTEKQMAKQKEIRDIAAGNTNIPPTERTITPTRTHTPSGPTHSPHRDQPHGTDTSGSFAGKGSGNPFGRARGGLAGLWPR